MLYFLNIVRCDGTANEYNLSYDPIKERSSLRRFSRKSKSKKEIFVYVCCRKFPAKLDDKCIKCGKSFIYDLQVKHESIYLRKKWLSLHRRFSRKLLCVDKHQAGISIPSFTQISRQIRTVQTRCNLRLQPFNDES
jgi:hypothetical protein